MLYFGLTSLFFFGGMLLLFPSSILDTYQPGESYLLSSYIFLSFHTVHGVLKARMLKWFVIAFSSGPCFVSFPPCLIHLGWTWRAWLMISLSYTKLWSRWSFWLVFSDCGFHYGGHTIAVLASYAFPLIDEDKRLVQASCYWGLAMGKIGSFSGGQGHAQ